MDYSICPICNLCVSSLELQRHANDHFSDENEDRDLQLALSISIIPPSPTPAVEDSFKYRPGYRGESSSSSCDATAPSIGGNGNDGKFASLISSQRKEILYTVENGLIALLRKCLELESEYSTSVLCGHIDHFQSNKSWDVGWGCGWRNIQMLSSHLIRQRQEAREILYGGSGFVPDIGSLQRWLELAWAKGYDTPGSDEFGQKIYGKRDWIGTTECAALFRSFGLRAKIVDFSSRDFELTSSDPRGFKKRKNMKVHGPMDTFLAKGKLDSCATVSSGKEGFGHSSVSSVDVRGHHVLSEWVWNYFSSNNGNKSGSRRVVLSEKAPLYFQHDGHSRTIIGIQAKQQKNGMRQYNLLILDPAERHDVKYDGHSRTIIGIQAKQQKNGMRQYNLLILDPAENTRALEKSLRENVGWQRLIKRGVHTLKKPQYQLCFIDPGIAHGEELEKLKTLHSIRHEF